MEGNLKYFVPDISDIRVGYECELLAADDKTWSKAIITEWCPGCQLDALRVPYLTKEQIEAEGWVLNKHQSGDHVTWFDKNRCSFLMWNSSYHCELDREEEFDIGYRGEIKDINTFRYITKLLNIN